MPTYPLPQKSLFSYREDPRAFRSPRSSERGRLHGAIDLYAPDGTEVYACEAGVVDRGPYPFVRYPDKEGVPYVDAIEIKAADGRILRYCELKFLPTLRKGVHVAEGELLGHLKLMPGLKAPGNCMLHFELFSGELYPGGELTGLLTQGPLPFRRRADHLNPTSYMDSCVLRNGDLSQPA